MLESSNGTGKFASVHVEVTFRSIKGIPVYVIQERFSRLTMVISDNVLPLCRSSEVCPDCCDLG